MIRSFGERSLLVDVADWRAARALAASIAAHPVRAIEAVVPALESVLVELAADGDRDDVRAELERRMAADIDLAPGRERTIPVVYGGEHGPDLEEVAAASGLSSDEYVRLHAASELRVLFCGFAPGFAYLGELPDELRVPRLATPRVRTPAGSVAVAGAMSGIYPAELPGGWRVVGRTPIVLFDPRREPPAYLAPGDSVRFEPITAESWSDRAGPASDW